MVVFFGILGFEVCVKVEDEVVLDYLNIDVMNDDLEFG